MDISMLIVSILTFITNLAMLVIAIFGIVIPIKSNFRKEQERSDKSIDILNTIIRDKIKVINLIIKVLEMYKIKPLTEAEVNKEESTKEKVLNMNEAHEVKIKYFINNNIESIAGIINYLERVKLIAVMENLRNEHSKFLFSKFNMMKNEDIDKLKKRINLIDEVLKDTRLIYKLVPESISKNKNKIDIEDYLETLKDKDLKLDIDVFYRIFLILQEFDQYKKKLKKIDKEL
ncbi:hypothetical protein ACUW54_002584 [Staphylococcus cohnii]|uniref:hypothetical protein n=1 Tax=Staphylococcus TaxID=1279 RepID=UPI000E69BD01|nr:hypothetical protein [Staphylococcus equorum]MEB7746527.1 hypothetical protein [Staphylococcus equorum]RIL33814.1 hypothetical protein BUY86_11565 [Staphylococcus equorum]